MTSAQRPVLPGLPVRDRLWWLPRRGVGNGLDAAGWAPILDVDGDRAGELLALLAEHGVAAFAGPIAPGPGAATTARLWVGTERWSMAEDLLMQRLRASSSGGADPARPPRRRGDRSNHRTLPGTAGGVRKATPNRSSP